MFCKFCGEETNKPSGFCKKRCSQYYDNEVVTGRARPYTMDIADRIAHKRFFDLCRPLKDRTIDRSCLKCRNTFRAFLNQRVCFACQDSYKCLGQLAI